MTTLIEVLEEARELGFLGPGPIGPQIEHARGFARAVPRPPGRALDLGTGGGLPGLVLAEHWPDTPWVLLDSHQRRTAFLTEAVGRLGWAGRVTVIRARAESLAHEPAHRGQYDLVTARSFGPPAVVAECAAGFLAAGGGLVVSEPPEEQDRWPADGLAQLGLVREASSPVATGTQLVVLRQATPCPERFPRAVGRPAKRPLF